MARGGVGAARHEAVPEGRDRSRAVTAESVQAAKDAVIERRETHLDQLARRLREERVRRVVEPMRRGGPRWYVGPDGRLDLEKRLSTFQEFFREHSEHWVERFDYKAAGPSGAAGGNQARAARALDTRPWILSDHLCKHGLHEELLGKGG